MYYFLPLNGRKRFGEVTHGILPDICCCSSSIPCGIALIPQFTAGNINGAPVLLLYSSGSYKTKANSDSKEAEVELIVNSNFPVTGKINIDVRRGDTDDLLQITITDDGIGRAKAAELKSKSAIKQKSFGMKVTSERIAIINQLFNTNTTVQIIDLMYDNGKAAGTQVIIQIPV